MSGTPTDADRGEPLPVARFDYDLPQDLIAQRPIEPRDASRLLVVGRASGALTDATFRDLPTFLCPGDLIVINDTRVFPARLVVTRQSGGSGEVLLLSRVANERWLALARPGRRLKPGERLTVCDRDGAATDGVVTIAERQGDQFVVEVRDEDVARCGRAPLPPYIHEALDDAERYQTVYARKSGSAAAPTAGLHFTSEIMRACWDAGATFAAVTLHVGLDTFQPIKTEDARDHAMHSEWFQVSDPAEIRAAKEAGRRIVAVGTTAVRTLESAANRILHGCKAEAISGWTDVYITPGYQFKIVDGMVTNFHLPRTTLMLLVSAFAGESSIRRAYAHAIQERYRFLSFGDAMLIV